MENKEVPVNMKPAVEEFLANVDLNVEVFKGKMLNVVREKAPEEYAEFSRQMEDMTSFIKDVYLLSFHNFLKTMKKKALEQMNKEAAE